MYTHGHDKIQHDFKKNKNKRNVTYGTLWYNNNPYILAFTITITERERKFTK